MRETLYFYSNFKLNKIELISQNFSSLKLFKDLGISLFMNHIDSKNLKIDESVIVFQDEESKSNDNNEFSFIKE